MSGPLPDPKRRRRNKPTIPTTNLPAAGRSDPAPDPPHGYDFNAAADAWWEWAWATPQACAWDDGALYTVARRAQLEGDLAVLAGSIDVDEASLCDMLGIEDDKRIRKLARLFGDIRRIAGNEVSLMKEMRELDNKLGLNPEAMAKLRWTIVDDGSEQAPKTPAKRTDKQRANLSVVK